MEAPRRESAAAQSLTAVIAERVKALRNGARLSGPALATAMNERGIPWNRTTVAKLETGRRESISVQELLALALVLDVPPSWLLVDPKADTRVPIAEGVEVDPWSALLWMSGKEPLSDRGGAAWQHAAEVLLHGYLVSEMSEALDEPLRYVPSDDSEDIWQQRRAHDENHRSYLQVMFQAMTRLEQMGVQLPPLRPHVLQRARELHIKMPGQDVEEGAS